jgi:hypothetical protein
MARRCLTLEPGAAGAALAELATVGTASLLATLPDVGRFDPAGNCQRR